MLTAQAVIRTEHPDQYLARFGKHAAKMGSGLRHRPRAHGSGQAPPGIQNAEWSSTRGTVTLNWGRWTAEAAPGMLTLRAEAADAENLQKIQDMLTHPAPGLRQARTRDRDLAAARNARCRAGPRPIAARRRAGLGCCRPAAVQEPGELTARQGDLPGRAIGPKRRDRRPYSTGVSAGQGECRGPQERRAARR